jgi:hypothetical protein
MKTQVLLLLLVAVLLAASTSALGPASGAAQAPPGASYVVQGGIIAGAGYRLTTWTWQVRGTASGGGYQLLGPASATLQGSGCCCTYLPGIGRKHQ